MQKLISFAVPCYNSENYMRKCVDSLLRGGERVEVVIINDGSKDETAAIADEYAAKYPDSVRAVHQQNAGHGGAVNAGLRAATGLYFKVVDSDDYLDESALKAVIRCLSDLERAGTPVDGLITNYMYDKQGAARKKVVRYRSLFPRNRIFRWNESRVQLPGQNLLMHSLTYRRQVLLDCGIELPTHTFYVDNLMAYLPLPHMETLYYLDVDLYRYFIGRSDQSVNEQVMVKRQDQQRRVTDIMIREGRLSPEIGKKRRRYMMNYLNMILTVSSVMFYLDGSDTSLQKQKDMWQLLAETDLAVYRRLRYRSLLGVGTNLPGKTGRRATIRIYKLTQKLYGFN
ncbi:MAG: glycosyltransferase [Clostridia bacterium]|nr:glycosyltransferase [Clostridia bacterium]